MAYSFADGSRFFIGDGFGASVAISSISNDDPAVVTTGTTHGFSSNDEILIDSEWDDISGGVYLAKDASGSSFTLGGDPGIDTSNTDFYPAGANAGAGSAKKVSTWVEIGQVLSISSSGGDPRFVEIAPLAKRNATQVPVGFNPQSIDIEVGYDPTMTSYKKMLAAARTLTPLPFRMQLAGGIRGYGYGYISVSELPLLDRDQPNRVNASIALLGKFIGYGA